MTFELHQFVILFFVGIFAGFMNVMAGGGSMITLPILAAYMPGPMANGTNRVAILLQNCTACGSYYRQKVAEPKLSFTFALCALPGALIGAHFGTKLEGPMFNYVLAGVMIMVLIYMIVSQYRRKKAGHVPNEQPTQDAPPPSRAKKLTGYLLMFIVGLYGGFIQAGVGIVIMASLNGALDMTLVRANIHKVFIIAAYTLVALLVFGLSGDIYWTAGLCLAAGNSIGAIVATRVNLKGGDRFIRVILYLVIIAMAAKLLYENFH